MKIRRWQRKTKHETSKILIELFLIPFLSVGFCKPFVLPLNILVDHLLGLLVFVFPILYPPQLNNNIS
jgi:hypothetical protein